MSIPIHRREIGEGWVITCFGECGEDLRLSDVNIENENIKCEVMGCVDVLSAEIVDREIVEPISSTCTNELSLNPDDGGNVEVSIFDHIGEVSVLHHIGGLIRRAQESGTLGIGKAPVKCIHYEELKGLPISDVIQSAIELWKTSEINDDELLQIAIRDISFQIDFLEGQPEEEATTVKSTRRKNTSQIENSSYNSVRNLSKPGSNFVWKELFNPRKDPTILYIELNKLTCCLDQFQFRIEPEKVVSVFDTAFEGCGSLSIQNLSIKSRVECRKKIMNKFGEETKVPALHLQELDVRLEKVLFKVKDTGVDWFFNKVVHGFRDNITKLVVFNLKDQIISHIHNALSILNTQIEMNPEIFLKILGITIDDLDKTLSED